MTVVTCIPIWYSIIVTGTNYRSTHTVFQTKDVALDSKYLKRNLVNFVRAHHLLIIIGINFGALKNRNKNDQSIYLGGLLYLDCIDGMYYTCILLFDCFEYMSHFWVSHNCIQIVWNLKLLMFKKSGMKLNCVFLLKKV